MRSISAIRLDRSLRARQKANWTCRWLWAEFIFWAYVKLSQSWQFFVLSILLSQKLSKKNHAREGIERNKNTKKSNYHTRSLILLKFCSQDFSAPYLFLCDSCFSCSSLPPETWFFLPPVTCLLPRDSCFLPPDSIGLDGGTSGRRQGNVVVGFQEKGPSFYTNKRWVIMCSFNDRFLLSSKCHKCPLVTMLQICNCWLVYLASQKTNKKG